MKLNKKGYEFPEYKMQIERGKLSEFVKAIGENNPIYFDGDAARTCGYKNISVPPTFIQVIDMWAGPDFETLCNTLNLNPLKVLHGEQEYQYFEDVYPGDVITARSKVIDIEIKNTKNKEMYIFHVETVYFNQKGQKVMTGLSKLIEIM